MIRLFIRSQSATFFLLIFTVSKIPAQEQAVLTVGALPAGAIRLDGAVTEPAWFAADSIGSFTMTEPVEGGTTVGRTVVRVLASERELVVSIVAADPEPDAVVSFSKQRDPMLEAEDHVMMVFDTFRDGRSGYTFGLNPTGARYDALVSGNGERQSADWDGIWDAATQVTESGWSAEVRLPITTLSFDPSLDEWGFNIQRRVQRLQEVSRWASPRRDYQVTQTARAGLLSGLPEFDLGIGISVRPSLIAKVGVPAPGAGSEESVEPALDATQRLSSNMLASLTVNTDFAETEVDTRQTNLTRFPLFFPEKRTFFLEGSDIFRFGFGLGQSLLPFHTRRLGLVEGTPVPIDAGGKLTGRVGNANLGGLVVRTGDVDSTLATTMGVDLGGRRIIKKSSLGFLGTAGDPLGRTGSWMGGVDFTYRTTRFLGDKNFVAGLWGLATDRDDLTSGDKTAFGFSLDYPNSLWDIFAAYSRIGDSFDPSLGFVPRPGIQEFRLFFMYMPRHVTSWMRVWRLQLRPQLVTDLDGNWESYRVFTAPVNWVFESGERLEINFVQEGEQLTEPFEIAEGVFIPVGAYHYQRYRAELDIATKRPVSGRLTWWFGPFYAGSLQQYQFNLSWKPSATFVLEVSGVKNVGDLPQGEFTQELLGTRVRVNVSPDFQINSFVQYDNDTRSFGTNTRLRWTFDPFGDLFVVYNHNVADFGNRWGRESNQLLVKAQYAVRR
jgi:hypothetical protein